MVPRMVDGRNRVALPRRIMEALQLVAGDYVTFDVDESGTVRILKLHLTVAPSRRDGRANASGSA